MNLKGQEEAGERMALAGKKSRVYDSDMLSTWKGMTEELKAESYIGLQSDLEKAVMTSNLLKAPASILLERLEKKFSAGASQTPGQTASLDGHTINVLVSVAKRMGELGFSDEQKQALTMLKFAKSEDLDKDQSLKSAWVTNVLGLAESYRSENNFLEAGRTYALAGDKATDFAGRAESLYKGGLLLYRAGRRDEAVDSFKKCGEDGQDRYYAGLCQERLKRMDQ
jgi:tetratricopeptide (TPR) repeat protein